MSNFKHNTSDFPKWKSILVLLFHTTLLPSHHLVSYRLKAADGEECLHSVVVLGFVDGEFLISLIQTSKKQFSNPPPVWWEIWFYEVQRNLANDFFDAQVQNKSCRFIFCWHKHESWSFFRLRIYLKNKYEQV